MVVFHREQPVRQKNPEGVLAARVRIFTVAYCTMLTGQSVTDWSGMWGVFYAMLTPALDPLFIAYNTSGGRGIPHTICIVRKYFTQ